MNKLNAKTHMTLQNRIGGNKWQRAGYRGKTGGLARISNSAERLGEKTFSYPFYFISENYHLIENNKEKKSDLKLVPNRTIEDQANHFKKENKRS